MRQFSLVKDVLVVCAKSWILSRSVSANLHRSVTAEIVSVFFIQKKCNSAVTLQCFMPCLFLTQRWLRFCDHVELGIIANRVESVASA